MIRHFSQTPTMSPDSRSPVVQCPLGGSHTHRETECPGHRVFQRPRGGGIAHTGFGESGDFGPPVGPATSETPVGFSAER